MNPVGLKKETTESQAETIKYRELLVKEILQDQVVRVE